MGLKVCKITNKGPNEKLLNFSIHESTLAIEVSCGHKDRDYQGIVLAYKHKSEQDRIAYLFSSEINQTSGDKTLSAKIELSDVPFKMSNWQILVAYNEGTELFGAPVKAPNKKQDIYKRFYDDYYCELENGYLVFPYYTKGGILNLRYRPRNEYDGQDVHDREVLADKYSRKFFGNKLRRQNIVLIYEKRCAAAQDNGYYLFKYCMEQGINEHGRIKVFFVIDKKSTAYQNIKQYDKYVLDFMSLEYMKHLKAAKILISSESRLHAYAWHSKNSIISPCIQEKKHVFLGHGILALKRLNNSFTSKNMASVLSTVSSEREGKIFQEYLGYESQNIAITGYARFDALEDKAAKHREILIMPTHRERLFGVEANLFCESEYYKRYMSLINSEKFGLILEENDIVAKFYLHPSIKEHTDLFKSKNKRIEIVHYGEVALDELMMRCKMLITDYSSIAWDVLYMQKPVLFYQFDREEYENSWGSYIDLEKDLPGDCETELEMLLGRIEQTISNGFKISATNATKLKDYYTYTDKNNCKRIWNEVEKLI